MRIRNLIFSLLLFFMMVSAVLIGRFAIPNEISDYWNDPLLRGLILQIRIPRILVCVVAGAGLALSGLVMQNVFQNYLADPGVLGINQAAGFGAALGYLINQSIRLPVQIFAFISGIVALILVLYLSQRIKIDNRISLIFAGIATSALFSAGLGIIKYIADPIDQLPSIVFWLLGSLSSTSWNTFFQIVPISLFCIFIILKLRWRINAYSLDSEVLHSLGIVGQREINQILAVTVLLTTSIISVAGLVGWVGLIIPNISRYYFGHDARQSIPTTILFGGGFLLVCDTLARVLLPGEIPLGIITAFIGAGVFIILLMQKKGSIFHGK